MLFSFVVDAFRRFTCGNGRLVQTIWILGCFPKRYPKGPSEEAYRKACAKIPIDKTLGSHLDYQVLLLHSVADSDILSGMARPLRIEYPNACYHVINRGNQRTTIFHDDWHYRLFVEKLGDFAVEFHVTVYAYCCMPNHFHLYLRTRDMNLSRFMQSFLTSFCVSSNRKRRSSGHIFQGRFKAQLVEDECYRSRLSRYIHLNPIRTHSFRETTPEERSDHLYKVNGRATVLILRS